VKEFFLKYRTFNFVDKFNYIIHISLAVLMCLCLYAIMYILVNILHFELSADNYLAWHNLCEISSIVVSFSIFLISYSTYDKTKSLRSILTGNVFLITAFIDIFHTLSYKGMSDFFIKNDDANRPTTFWIISRFCMAFGFLIISFIDEKRKSSLKKNFITIPALLFSIFCLYSVTYKPQLFPIMFNSSGLTQNKIISEYIIILIFFIGILRFSFEYKSTKDSMVLFLCITLICQIFSEFLFANYKDVYGTNNFIGHIYKVITYFIIFRVVFISNINKPYLELFEAKNELKMLIENQDKIINEHTKELINKNKLLVNDVEHAKNMQNALLPKNCLDFKNVHIDYKYMPADFLSGDFLNYFKLNDNHLLMYLSDVSGHGIPAAMLTIYLHQCLNTAVRVNLNDPIPSKILDFIYNEYNRSEFEECLYIILILAVYDFENNSLTYSSAGFNTEPIIVSATGECRKISLTGFPICKLLDIYNPVYTDIRIDLNKNEKVFFYTDGLIERVDSNLGFKIEDKIMEILSENYSKTTSEINKLILEFVLKNIGEEKLKDDISFFLLEIN